MESHFEEPEFRNFLEIAERISPSLSDIPDIDGIDIFGSTIPLHEGVGGDHIVFLDFEKRYDLEKRIQIALENGDAEKARKLNEQRQIGGVLLSDVAGHQMTDHALIIGLYYSFMIGVLYELDNHGTLTTDLFKKLNTRMFNDIPEYKFFEMMYGNINSQGRFNYISMGLPKPLVFSSERDELVRLNNNDYTHSFALGIMPSVGVTEYKGGYGAQIETDYRVNTVHLMNSGDFLLLHTDGFSDHLHLEDSYKPLERVLSQNKHRSSSDIYAAIKENLIVGPREDDISYVIIKRE